MIKGGVAWLADEVHTRCIQRRRCSPTPAPLLFDKHSKQGINIKYNAQSHEQDCNVLFMVAMCWAFHLKEVHCKGICKTSPNLNSKRIHMHICHCSPNLNWSNMKTKCIFRILAFFGNFAYIICPIWS